MGIFLGISGWRLIVDTIFKIHFGCLKLILSFKTDFGCGKTVLDLELSLEGIGEMI